MDWLRQLPIGQYVDGSGSWLVRLDPRLKLTWTVAFLVTPILAGSLWRLALVALLLLLTACSGRRPSCGSSPVDPRTHRPNAAVPPGSCCAWGPCR